MIMRKGFKSLGEQCHRAVVWLVIASFTVSLVAPQAAYAQAALMPQPGTRVQTSPVFTPPIITGIQLSPEDPLQINFLIDTGDNRASGHELKSASQKLINYFFAALTVPEDEMWVNLSPYERNKIIAGPLSHTDMGRDMLAQDYLLKQLSASMLYPEDELGRRFWSRVQQRALEKFGTTEIPMNTFNKIWIVPERAQVFVNGANVFIADSRLKVMLEEDYLALEHHAALESGAPQVDVRTGVSDEVVREVLIPEIEREINSGKNFAPLRQIYHSLILATWYKKNLRDSILGQVYVNRNKVDGIEIDELNIKEEIYNQYLAALQKGVFDYIREDLDPHTGTPIPRRYFSGGVDMAQLSAASLTQGMTEKLRAAAATRTFHTVETYAGLRQKSDGPDGAMFSTREEHLLNRLSWASPRMKQNAINKLLAIGESAIPIVAGQLHVLEERLVRLSSDPNTQTQHHLHRAILLALYAQTIAQTEKLLAEQSVEIDRPLDELSADELAPLVRRGNKYVIATGTGYDEWDPSTLEPGVTNPNPARIALAHKIERLLTSYRYLLRNRIAADLPEGVRDRITEEHIDIAEALVGNVTVGYDGKQIRLTPAPNALIIDHSIHVPEDGFGAMLMDAFAAARQQNQDVTVYLNGDVIKSFRTDSDPDKSLTDALRLARAKLGQRTGNLTMYRAGASVYLDTSPDLYEHFASIGQVTAPPAAATELQPVIIHRLPQEVSAHESVALPVESFHAVLRETFARAQTKAERVHIFINGASVRSIDPGTDLDALMTSVTDQTARQLAKQQGHLTIYTAGSSIHLDTAPSLFAHLTAAGLIGKDTGKVVLATVPSPAGTDQALLIDDSELSINVEEGLAEAREVRQDLMIYIEGQLALRLRPTTDTLTALAAIKFIVNNRFRDHPETPTFLTVNNEIHVQTEDTLTPDLLARFDAAMLSDAADRLEVNKREYAWTPEREENERQAERRAAIEIRQRLGQLHGEAEAIMALRRSARSDDDRQKIELREEQLLSGMRQLYLEMPVQIVQGKDYEFYSQALQDLKRDRRRIAAHIRIADAAGNKKRVARLNRLAIRNNRLLVKTQLLVAGLLQTGRSRDDVRHPTPALNALEGAINSASALEIELEYRIQRLRGRKFRRVIETQDWVGNQVRTFRLGSFDIDIEKPRKGEEQPRVKVRQKRPVNVHTRLDRIRRMVNKGEIAGAIKQIDFLIGIYRLQYFKTLESYKGIERDLRALRAAVAALPEGEALAKGEVKDDIKARVTALTDNIKAPKQMVWDDVTYRNRRKAFTGQIRKIASELAEYMVVLKNRSDLGYYAQKLGRARQRQERGRAVTLSQRDRRMIVEKLEELQQWTQRGFVESKVTAAIDFAPVIELMGQNDFKRAEQHLQTIITGLSKRLEDIERIIDNLKQSAASLFAEFRRSDIIERAEEIIQAVNEEEFGPALELLNDMEDDYFQFDHPEPGLVRAARRIKEARSVLAELRPETVIAQNTADLLYEILWKIKEDAQHPSRYRVNILNEKGQQKVYYVEPGITVQGLLNVGRRDSARTVVLIDGQAVDRSAYASTRIGDDSRVELRRDEAVIVVESERIHAALAAAREYTEAYNAKYPDEPLKIHVLLNHDTLVRWDTQGSQDGLFEFVTGKLRKQNPTNLPGDVSIRTTANRVHIHWKPDGSPDLLGPDDGGLGGDAAMLSQADRFRLLLGIQSMNNVLSKIDTAPVDSLIERGQFLNSRGEEVESIALRVWTTGPEIQDGKQNLLTRRAAEYLSEQLGVATLYRMSPASFRTPAEAPHLWVVGENVISGLYLELPDTARSDREVREMISRARGLLETLLATISLSLPRELFTPPAADGAVLVLPKQETPLLETRLEDGPLNLSTRVVNILQLNRITTVGDLTALSLRRLQSMTNIGKAGRDEIIEALAQHGLTLRRTAFVRAPNQYQINEIVLEAYANQSGPRHRKITVFINGEPVEYAYANRGEVDGIGLDIYNRVQEALGADRTAFSISLDNTEIRVQADAALLAHDDDLQAWLEQRGVPEPDKFLDNLTWIRDLNEPHLKLSAHSLAVVRDVILSNLIYGHPLDVIAVGKLGLAMDQYRRMIEAEPQSEIMRGMQPFIIGKGRETLEERIRYMLLNNDQRRLAKALLHFNGSNIGEVIDILDQDPHEYHIDISRAEAQEFYRLLTPLLEALPLLQWGDDAPPTAEVRALAASRIGQLVDQLYQRRGQTAHLLARYILNELSALKLVLQGDNLTHLSRYTEDQAVFADDDSGDFRRGGSGETGRRVQLRRLRERIEADLAGRQPVDISRIRPTTITGAEQVLDYLRPFFPDNSALHDRATVTETLHNWFFDEETDFSGSIVAVVRRSGETAPLGYLDQNIAELFDLPYIAADESILVNAVESIAEQLEVTEQTVANALGQSLSLTQVLVRWEVLARDMGLPDQVREGILRTLEESLSRHSQPYDAAAITEAIFETESAYKKSLPASRQRETVVTIAGTPDHRQIDYPIGLLRSLFYIIGSSVDWQLFAELIEKETGTSVGDVRERLDDMAFRFIFSPYIMEFVTVNGLVVGTKMRFPSFADFVNYQRGTRPGGKLINRGTPIEITTADDPQNPVKTVFERLDDDAQPTALFTGIGFFDASIIKEIAYIDYTLGRDMAIFGRRTGDDQERTGWSRRKKILVFTALLLAGVGTVTVYNIATYDDGIVDMSDLSDLEDYYDFTLTEKMDEVQSLLRRNRPVPGRLMHRLYLLRTEIQGVLETETQTPRPEADQLRDLLEGKLGELNAVIARAEQNIAAEQNSAEFQETVESIQIRYRDIRWVAKSARTTAAQAIDQVIIDMRDLRSRLAAAESSMNGITPLIEQVDRLIGEATEFQAQLRSQENERDNGMLAQPQATSNIAALISLWHELAGDTDAAVMSVGDVPTDAATFAELSVPETDQILVLEKPIELHVQIVEGEVQIDTGTNDQYAEYAAVLIDEIEYHLKRLDADPAVLEQIRDFRVVITTDTTTQNRDDVIYKLPLAPNGNPYAAHSSVSKKVVILHPYFFSDKVDQLRRLLFTHELISKIGKQTTDHAAATENTHAYLREEFAAEDLDVPSLLQASRELSRPEKAFIADIRRQRNYRSGLNDIAEEKVPTAVKDAVLAATQFLELYAASTDKFNFDGVTARAELAENPGIVAAFGRYLAGEMSADDVTALIEGSESAWLGTVFDKALRHVKSSNVFTVLRKDFDPVTLVIDARALTQDKRVVDYVFSYRPGYFYALTQIVDRPNGQGTLAQGGIRFKSLNRRDAKGKLMEAEEAAYENFRTAFAEVDMISRSKFQRNTVTQTPFSGAKTIMTVFPDSKNIKTLLLKSLARSYVDAGVTSRYIIGTESGMTAKDQDTLAQAIGTRYRDHLTHELEQLKTIPSVGEDLSKIKSTSQYGKHLRTLEKEKPGTGRFLQDPLMDALRQRVVASLHLGQQNGGTSLVKLFSSRLEADIARTIGAAATGRLTDKELNALREWSLAAFSAAMSIEAIDEYMGDLDLRGRKIGIRGATTGGSLALMLARMGYQIVAIEDINGTIYKKDGFSVAELQRLDNIAFNQRDVTQWMPEEPGVVQHLPKGSLGDKEQMDLDILISAAPGHHLDGDAVARMRGIDDDPDRDPLIYVEAGFNSINGFENELHRRGILAFKATSIGFGGAYGSYLEDYIKHRFTSEQLRRNIIRSGDTDVVTSPAIVVNDRITVTNYTGNETIGEVVVENGIVVHSTVDDILVGMNLELFQGRMLSLGIKLPYQFRKRIKTLIWDNFRVVMDDQGYIRKSNHPELEQGKLAVFIDPVQEIRMTAYQDIKGIAKRMNTMVMELARNGNGTDNGKFRMTPSQAIRKISKLIADKKRHFDTSSDERLIEAIQAIMDKFETDGFFFPPHIARKIAIKRLVSSSDLSIEIGDETFYFNAEGLLVKTPENGSEDAPGHVRMTEAMSGSFDFSLSTARRMEKSLRKQESRALEAHHLVGLDKRLRSRASQELEPPSAGTSIEESLLEESVSSKKETRPEATRYLLSQRAQKTNRAGLDKAIPNVAPRRRDILLGAATFLEILSHYEVKHNRGTYFDSIAAIEELVANPQIASLMTEYIEDPQGTIEALESLLDRSDTQWLKILFERGIKNITATSANVIDPEKKEEATGGSREAIAIRFNGVDLTGVRNKKEIVFIYLPGRFYAITQLVDLSAANHTKGGIRYAEPVARPNDPKKRNVDEVAFDIMTGAYEDLNNLSVSQYSKNVLAGIGYAGAKTYFGVHQDVTSMKDEQLRSWARAMVDVGLMEVYDGGPDVGMSSANQETIIASIVRRYTMHLMNEVRLMHANGVDIFNLNLTTYGNALEEIESKTGREFLDDTLIGYMRKRLLLELPKGKENGSVVIERVFNRKLKDEIGKIIGSAVTGGSAKVGAISHVELAVTGDSTLRSIEAILRYKGLDPKTLKAAVVGAGDVGGSVALKMARLGITVIGISDINGAVHKPAGFTIEELQNLNNIQPGDRNVLEWMPEQDGVEHLKGLELLDKSKVDIDLLVPAAMGGLIQTTKTTQSMVDAALKKANLPNVTVDVKFVETLDSFRTRYNDEYITEHIRRHMGADPSSPAQRKADFESYINELVERFPGELGDHPQRKEFETALAELWMKRKGTIELLRTADDEPERTPLMIIEGSNNAFVGVEEELKKRGILAVSGMSVNFGGVKGSTKEAMLKHLLTVRELRTITLRNNEGTVIETAINTDVTERITVVADGTGTELGTIAVHNGFVVSSDIEEISIGSNLDPLNGRLFNRGDDLGYTIGSLERRLAWDNYVVVQQGHGTVTASNHPDITIGGSYEYLDPLDRIKIELYDEIHQIARRNNIMVMELATKFDMTPTEAVVRLARALGQRKADIYAATEGEDLVKRDVIVARFKKEKYFMADHIMRNIAAIQVAAESNLSLTIGEGEEAETVTFDADGYIVDGAMTAQQSGEAEVTYLDTALRQKIVALIETKMLETGADIGMLQWITDENIAEAAKLQAKDGRFHVTVQFTLQRVEIRPVTKDQAITAEEARKILEYHVPFYLDHLITQEAIETTIRANGRVRVSIDKPDPIAEDLKWDDLAATGITVTPIDQAVTAEEPGGIDFNTRNMDLEVTGGTFEFTGPPLTVEDLNPLHIQGLQPVIINITPIPNLMPLLGLGDKIPAGIRSAQQGAPQTPAAEGRLTFGAARAADPRDGLIQALSSVL